MVLFLFITARICSVWEGDVFTHVCLSVCPTLDGGSPHVNFAHDALGHSILVYGHYGIGHMGHPPRSVGRRGPPLQKWRQKRTPPPRSVGRRGPPPPEVEAEEEPLPKLVMEEDHTPPPQKWWWKRTPLEVVVEEDPPPPPQKWWWKRTS